MTDHILEARLKALEQSLRRVEDPKNWPEEMSLQRWRPKKEVWDLLARAIRTQVTGQIREVTRIRTLMNQPGAGSLEEAWRGFTTLSNDSQRLFRECLELTGGFAFRDAFSDKQGKWLDASICEVADELINDCANDTGLDFTLTIPAPEEALTKTIARIIRLRFPEWTIWSLPFTAHEYGHVIAVEEGALPSIIEQEVANLMQQRQPPAPETEEARKRAERQATQMHDELLADAFATYTMGPAYACAAVFLRLNPAGDPRTGDIHGEEVEVPLPAQRARVILGILGKMNDETGGQYGPVITLLSQEWHDMVQRARPAQALEAAEVQRLDRFIQLVWSEFPNAVREAARYSYTPSVGHLYGWSAAHMWAMDWRKALQDSTELAIPPVEPVSKLRDALNAAWFCRIKSEPGAVNSIAKAARTLCETIIRKRAEPQPAGPGVQPGLTTAPASATPIR